jgi:hypothetical protein
MSREILAYFILMLLAACATAVVVYSRRFLRYQREFRRGKYGLKRVWKPFWIP